MEGHKREYHGVGTKEQCVCGKSFSYNCNLSAHMKICPILNPSKKPAFTCDICGKIYKAKNNLKKHIKYDHSGMQGMFVCDVCGEHFTRPHSLTRHKQRKHINYNIE